jgi:subtilase-type serine protease
MLALASTPVCSEPWYLKKVNADAAHKMGHTGTDVVVGVVDSGIDRDHPAFANRMDPRSYNFYSGPRHELGPLHPEDTHGTAVAGLIGAARGKGPMYGIAYDSKILALRAMGKDHDIQDNDPGLSALKYAVDARVQVINGSFSQPAAPLRFIVNPDDPKGPRIPNPNYRHVSFHAYTFDENFEYVVPPMLRTLRAAAAADILMVFSAGNDYAEQPEAAANPRGIVLLPYMKPENHDKGVYTLLADGTDINNPSTYRPVSAADPRRALVDYSALQGSIIGVVATDRNDRIAKYSTRCGVAWQWCLAAPGGDSEADGRYIEEGVLQVPVPGGKYSHFAGTSAAAPLVSGAAAVVRGAFPYLTAKQTAELLLTTTNTEGHLGERAVYGRGMLDVGRAVLGPREFGAEGFARIFDVNTRGHDSTWSGDIHGEGGLTKRGAGTLTLTGNNIYSGSTTVAGGALVVNGSNARSTTIVQQRGRLSGTGTVGATHVHGTIAPGATLGTLTVAGNYHQTSTAVYEATITPDQGSNRLVVQDRANLQGGTLKVNGISLATLNKQYTLIQTTNGLAGDFDNTLDNYLFIDLQTRKTDNDYTITVGRNAGGFGMVAKTANERAAGVGLDGLAAGNPLFDTLVMQNDPAAARTALGQLSGEIHPSVLGTLNKQSGLVRNALIGRLIHASEHASSDARRAVWGQYLGSWNHVASDGNAAAVSSSYNGLLFGADTAVTASTRLGLAVSAGKADASVNAFQSRAKIDDYTLAAYGESQFGTAKLKYGSAYGWHGIDSQRNVAFANAGQSKARYDAHTVQVFSELSTVRSLGSVELEPYAGLAYVNTRADAFKESGLAGLRGDDSSQKSTLSTLGMRARTTWDLAKQGSISLSGGLGWRHAFGEVTPTTRMRFEGAYAFTVAGAPLARNALLVDAGLAWNLTDRATVGVSYASQLGNGVNDQSVQARGVWRF